MTVGELLRTPLPRTPVNKEASPEATVRCSGASFSTIGSCTDLIGASFAESFVYFDVDAPPYPARNTLHAGRDTYLEISVRPS
jgi:hypothetical protein